MRSIVFLFVRRIELEKQKYLLVGFGGVNNDLG